MSRIPSPVRQRFGPDAEKSSASAKTRRTTRGPKTGATRVSMSVLPKLISAQKNTRLKDSRKNKNKTFYGFIMIDIFLRVSLEKG